VSVCGARLLQCLCMGMGDSHRRKCIHNNVCRQTVHRMGSPLCLLQSIRFPLPMLLYSLFAIAFSAPHIRRRHSLSLPAECSSFNRRCLALLAKHQPTNCCSSPATWPEIEDCNLQPPVLAPFSFLHGAFAANRHSSVWASLRMP